MSTCRTFGFPLGKTGGLIEAQRSPLHSSRWAGCFRWVKPAASLKPHSCIVMARSVCTRFRWVKPAASLKQIDLQVRRVGLPRPFPLGKTGGLIEASSTLELPPDQVAVVFRWVKPAASLKHVHFASILGIVGYVSAG